MRPQRGNPGARIRDNFTRQERLDALAEFYKHFRDKYLDLNQAKSLRFLAGVLGVRRRRAGAVAAGRL
jgi:hypothetical protein